MKKDHSKDLSLLYYDFNNSKARLMSKMKKMSDFVIQEETELDGDLTPNMNVQIPLKIKFKDNNKDDESPHFSSKEDGKITV